MRAARAAWLAVLVLAVAARADDPEACRAEATLEPAEVVVGEQVLYRLRIFTRDDVEWLDWVEPPSFPGFRAERLPGSPQPADIAPGQRYRVREEHRALFPEREGELVVRVAGLRCRVRDGAGSVAPVPDALLRVRPLPAAGRPPGLAGLVGPLVLRARVAPRQVALGESVRVEITLRGGGNLWDAPDPFPDDAAFGGAELFRERPRLALEPGRRLFVKRDFAYDVVPRREGVLVIPAVQIDYFDPATRRYARATTPAEEIPVAARAGAPPTGPRAEPGGTRSTQRAIPWPGLALLVGALGLVAGAVHRAAARRRWLGGRSAALDEADRARARGDREAAAAVLARVLRAALACRLPEVRDVDPAALAARRDLPLPLAEAARLLAASERARFDPSVAPPERDAVERALASL